MPVTFQSLIAADASRDQIEHWCRSQAQVMPAGNYNLCRALGKYLMYVLPRDMALAPHLALGGIWEPWITMAIARHLRPGMHCMDVGACYGYYALLMADMVGPGGYVEAWEPVWSKLTAHNAEINGLQVAVVRAAMASERRLLQIDYPQVSEMFNAGDVPLLPMHADLIRALPCVETQSPIGRTYDFIKIDVEGAEADVWNALQHVRAASPKLTVCMEFTPEKHENPDQLLLKIEGEGFTMGTVGHDGVPRPCSIEEAVVPDTGAFRMLWLTRKS